MKEELKNTLFTHQNMDSALYYFSGTVVLVIATIGLVGIFIYSIYQSVKKSKDPIPKEIHNYKKINILHASLVVISSCLVFIISITVFPKPIVIGRAENIGILIIFPFIAGVIFGELKKVKKLARFEFIKGLSLWRVFWFCFIYLTLRIIFF
ncbi:MAG: hypothetical protein QF441_12970 [Bacteriovoracaceae bacterium]|jgi:hypothetical protein|nr:hypothetical protein [Bacteriovoracaceae bacterium]